MMRVGDLVVIRGRINGVTPYKVVHVNALNDMIVVEVPEGNADGINGWEGHCEPDLHLDNNKRYWWLTTYLKVCRNKMDV